MSSFEGMVFSGGISWCKDFEMVESLVVQEIKGVFMGEVQLIVGKVVGNVCGQVKFQLCRRLQLW